MTAKIDIGSQPAGLKPFVAPAQTQTSLSSEQILHSANCGVMIQRTGQLKSEFRSEGRMFARELADYINNNHAGIATALLYEEAFGTKDRIHWLIHLRSLGDYHTLTDTYYNDAAFRSILGQDRISPEKGGGTWGKMFVEGSLSETALIPQQWRMSGTVAEKAPLSGASNSLAATAQHQTSLPPEQILHSANCGVMIQRTGQLKSEFRSEGRMFARELADYINNNQPGVATVFLYEEQFRIHDRIHWLIHLNALGDYYKLIQMGDSDEGFRHILSKNRIPSEKGGGKGDKMFLHGTFNETALVPQHWRMFATQK